MNEILADFEQYLRGEKDASPATVHAYLNDLKKFFKWYLETTGDAARIDAIGPLDIAEFKRHILNKSETCYNQPGACFSFCIFLIGQFAKVTPPKIL